MIEGDEVRAIRELTAQGWGSKRIAQELGLARNTVRRYVRGGAAAERQTRPAARRLDDGGVARAAELLEGTAEGNAVVVCELLRAEGVEASVRTVQRAVAERRQEIRAEGLATVRYETAPGKQMQVDFGQKRVRIGGIVVVVHLLVAVLCYSRRIFVKAFLNERGDDWREGIAAALVHFGGVVEEILGDNAKPLVKHRSPETGTAIFHPRYVEFCKDWGVVPRACAPYRARTKGKTESGVKYVKRNALAGREFESFVQLEAHLSVWSDAADRRVHGTTHEQPIDRFEREERQALRSLPERPLPRREQRLRRRVANDAYVDVDTIRYSVPHRLVRSHVEVAVGDSEVRIFHGTDQVAAHRRETEPHAMVTDPSHQVGLWRRPEEAGEVPAALAPHGRSLVDYALVVGEIA